MNIHITKEEKEALKSLVSGGYAAADNLKAVADAISVITESLELYSSDYYPTPLKCTEYASRACW